MTGATPSLARIGSHLGRWSIGWGGVLNVVSVGLGVAAVLALAEPEVMLDALWVTLAIGAFVFTLAVALVRLVVGSIFIFVVMLQEAFREGEPFEMELLDLAEWPLLVTISLIVTFMAHRLATTTRR